MSTAHTSTPALALLSLLLTACVTLAAPGCGADSSAAGSADSSTSAADGTAGSSGGGSTAGGGAGASDGSDSPSEAGPTGPGGGGSDAGAGPGGGGGDGVCVAKTCVTAGATCGTMPNGCGGTLDCGGCVPGWSCGAGGIPHRCGKDEPACTPSVTCESAGAACGHIDDGCGGWLSCGSCAPGTLCQAGTCVCAATTCESAGAQCGLLDDGCGGVLQCGTCAGGAACLAGACASCTPTCDGKSCGPDGCGGTCGMCPESKVCVDGGCVTAICSGQCGSATPKWCGLGCKCYCNADCFQYGDCCADVCESCFDLYSDQCCLPDCAGKQCGDDGCGGSCGACAPGTLCDADAGVCEACEAACEGKECGDDGCGGVCGQCASSYDECVEGGCVVCQPQCDGKQCGDDGCGGVCGQCGEGQSCTTAGECLDCIPDCKGKVCGDNGCGGECGDCPVDCALIPPGPFSLDKLSGPIASEDLAFDDAGNVIGSNDNAIFKSQYGQSPQLWVPNIQFRAGLRFISTGDLMVNNDNTGQLLRVEPNGTVNVVLSNLAYPNGLAADLDGHIFVTEHDAKRVLRVEPYSGQVDTISSGLISNPNGIAFNPDYSTFVVAGFSGVGTIYAFDVDANGDVGEAYAWATNVGSGWLDGIGFDICGNLYIADYSATKIFRFPAGSTSYETIMSGTGNTYLPNMQWGSGYGGWDEYKLYLPDGWNKGVFEVDVGVPGIQRAWPPVNPDESQL